MSLPEWARAQGIHVPAACRWCREGGLPVRARKVGRLVLVSPETAAAPSPGGGAGLYARVSSHDQKAGRVRQGARLAVWAERAGLPVVRVEAEADSGMDGARATARRLLAGPAARVAVLDDGEVTDGLVRDLIGVLASFCARLYGRRSARNRAVRAVGYARRGIGPRAAAALAVGGAPRCGGGG